LELVKIFKALEDETRLRILNLLRNSELCVCEIQYTLETTQSNTSRHLTNLSNTGLAIPTKKAQWVSYKINEDILLEHPFIQEVLSHELDKLEQCKRDLEKLAECQNNGIPCELTKEG